MPESRIIDLMEALKASLRATGLGVQWRASKESGLAVDLAPTTSEHDEDGGAWLAARRRHEFRVQLQRHENERRDFASLAVCHVALMAYEESRHIYARRLARGVGASHLAESLIADESQPSYTELRNFLVGELDARYVTACQAAFARVAMNNRLMRSSWRGVNEAWHGTNYGSCGAERGWL